MSKGGAQQKKTTKTNDLPLKINKLPKLTASSAPKKKIGRNPKKERLVGLQTTINFRGDVSVPRSESISSKACFVSKEKRDVLLKTHTLPVWILSVWDLVV